MPVPTNTTSGTAIELGPLTRTVAQNVNDSGTTYTVWYKYTIQPGDTTIGVFALGDPSGLVYRPRVSVYASDGTTVFHNFSTFANIVNQPIMVPVAGAGGVIYFQIDSFSGDVATADLTLTGTASPSTAVGIGDLLIPDDTDDSDGGFQAAIMSQVDGTIKGFTTVVQGEIGAMLPDGTFALWNDQVGGDPLTLYLYSGLLAQIATVTTTPGTSIRRLAASTSSFYFAEASGFSSFTVKRLSATGTIGTTWTIASSLYAIGADRADTVLYYSTGNSGDPIKRWNLSSNTAMSNFATAPSASYFADREILVLSDGSVVVMWSNTGVDYIVRRYDASGTQLTSFTYPFPSGITDGPRLAIASDDPNSFWVWASGMDVDSNRVSQFNRYAPSGTLLTTFSPYVFEAGLGPILTTGPWPAFGNSKSCPFLAARVSTRTLLPVPATPPVIPGTCCSPTPTSTSITSPKPSAGTNKGGVGSCTFYSGPSGVVPIGADPADGDTLTGKRTVYVWAEVQHVDY